MDYRTCKECIGRACPHNSECIAKRKEEEAKAVAELKKNFWKECEKRS